MGAPSIALQLLQFPFGQNSRFLSGRPSLRWLFARGSDKRGRNRLWARPSAMKCPFCGFANDKVVDSRESKEADSIRRRRECLKCEKRFTTYERIDEIPYMVVKKDGRREKFDRQKVLNGLLRACEKRPVPISKLEQIVNEAEIVCHRFGRAGAQDQRTRRADHEPAATVRQSRLCAIRLGLSRFQRCQRVHE